MEINMEEVVKSIFSVTVYLVIILIYVFLIAKIIPKYCLKISGDSNYTLGRGLKKFVYPDGRAVVYEPHPSIRKYIEKYALFTLDGYKYVQFSMSQAVKNYTLKITMFDNQNRVIDTLEVSEYTVASRTPCPVKLHADTSYVAISLLDINRLPVAKSNGEQIQISGGLFYILYAFLATFLEILYTFTTFNSLFEIDNSDVFTASIFMFIVASALIIGVVCFMITVLSRMEKGVKVVFK